jgi:hypothetical protein
MKSRIFRQKNRFPGDYGEFLFAVGAAGIDEVGNVRGSGCAAVRGSWCFVLGEASRLVVAETSVVGLMNVD